MLTCTIALLSTSLWSLVTQNVSLSRLTFVAQLLVAQLVCRPDDYKFSSDAWS